MAHQFGLIHHRRVDGAFHRPSDPGLARVLPGIANLASAGEVEDHGVSVRQQAPIGGEGVLRTAIHLRRRRAEEGVVEEDQQVVVRAGLCVVDQAGHGLVGRRKRGAAGGTRP